MYFRPHQLQIVLLVDPTKRKKHTFVDLTKPKTFTYFRPHHLRIVLLVDPTKRKNHTFVNLTKLSCIKGLIMIDFLSTITLSDKVINMMVDILGG